MKIKLVRDRAHSHGSALYGHLYVNDKPECWTLEDIEREVKIPGKTAIPTGEYEVIITPSNRFKRDLPLLLDVPNFTGVRIHTGNSPADTEGCILVGDAPDPAEEWIGQSRAAFSRLFPKIQSAVMGGEKVTIEVL